MTIIGLIDEYIYAGVKLRRNVSSDSPVENCFEQLIQLARLTKKDPCKVRLTTEVVMHIPGACTILSPELLNGFIQFYFLAELLRTWPEDRVAELEIDDEGINEIAIVGALLSFATALLKAEKIKLSLDFNTLAAAEHEYRLDPRASDLATTVAAAVKKETRHSELVAIFEAHAREASLLLRARILSLLAGLPPTTTPLAAYKQLIATFRLGGQHDLPPTIVSMLEKYS
jgi:hypothetical protein